MGLGSALERFRLHPHVWNTVTSRRPFGTNVFSRDWDALIVLDSCRVDALRSVADEYDFIHDVGSIRSVGSMSAEWTVKTFTNEYLNEIQKTSLLMSHGWFYNVLGERLQEFDSVSDAQENLVSDRLTVTDYYRFFYQGYPDWDVCSLSDFVGVDHVWKLRTMVADSSDYSHSPDIITDRAIDFGRSQESERLIVHYMLPHTPFEGLARKDNRELEKWEENPFQAGRNGEKTTEELLAGHRENVRYVLEYVETLLNNLDAEKVVLTADHGEFLGELSTYGHPWGHLHPVVRRVPWAVTSGNDSGEYTSQYQRTKTSDIESGDIESNLQALGYI